MLTVARDNVTAEHGIFVITSCCNDDDGDIYSKKRLSFQFSDQKTLQWDLKTSRWPFWFLFSDYFVYVLRAFFFFLNFSTRFLNHLFTFIRHGIFLTYFFTFSNSFSHPRNFFLSYYLLDNRATCKKLAHFWHFRDIFYLFPSIWSLSLHINAR